MSISLDLILAIIDLAEHIFFPDDEVQEDSKYEAN